MQINAWFNTINVHIINDCSSLKEIYFMPSFNTEYIKDMSFLFSLKEIDLSSLKLKMKKQ